MRPDKNRKLNAQLRQSADGRPQMADVVLWTWIRKFPWYNPSRRESAL